METFSSRRRISVAMALLFFCYVAFVVSTDPGSFGLTIQPDGHSIWVVIRLLTFGLWLVLAALLLKARRSPISWRSFAYAFLGSCVVAIVIAPTLVPSAANHASVVGTIGMYASAAGFVCITVTRSLRALVFGALLFPIQLLVDATSHLLSGQFRLH